MRQVDARVAPKMELAHFSRLRCLSIFTFTVLVHLVQLTTCSFVYSKTIVRLVGDLAHELSRDALLDAENHGAHVLRIAQNGLRADVLMQMPVANASSIVAARLMRTGFRIKIIASAAQMNVVFRQERERPRRLTASLAARAHAGDRDGLQSAWHEAFHPLSEIYAWMRRTATALPTVASIVRVGKSAEGRDVLGLKISGNGLAAWHFGSQGSAAPHRRPRPLPLVVLDGAIHAREWITSAALQYFVSALMERPALNTSAATTMRHSPTGSYAIMRQPLGSLGAHARYNVDVLVLPVLNPDGYAYSWTDDRFFRTNRRGVDLARNFPTGWHRADYMERRSGSHLYRGAYPLSAPESAALADYLRNHSTQLASYVNLHAQAAKWLVPYCFSRNKTHDYTRQVDVGNAALKAAAAVATLRGPHELDGDDDDIASGGGPCRACGAYAAGLAAELLYPAHGVPSDWVYDELNVTLSVAFELRAGNRDQGQAFVDSPDRIVPLSQEAVAALGVLLSEAATKQLIGLLSNTSSTGLGGSAPAGPGSMAAVHVVAGVVLAGFVAAGVVWLRCRCKILRGYHAVHVPPSTCATQQEQEQDWAGDRITSIISVPANPVAASISSGSVG